MIAISSNKRAKLKNYIMDVCDFKTICKNIQKKLICKFSTIKNKKVEIATSGTRQHNLNFFFKYLLCKILNKE